MSSSSMMSSPDILLEWFSHNSATLFWMKRRRLNKRWYGLLSFVIVDMNERFRYYIVNTNGEELWARRNSSFTVRHWQSHYFHRPCTPLQEVGYLAYTDWQHTRCPYGIHCLFHTISRSLDYFYFYYVFIFILSYSLLYCSFHILFLSSDYCFHLNVY